MSEKMKRSIHNANIGLAVSMIVLVGGVVILRNSDALGLVALATFFTAFGIYSFLDERDRRRQSGGREQRQ